MQTAAVVLAAGRAARLGGSRVKPLLLLEGRPLVRWALDAALASGCRPVMLVVGHEGDAVAAAVSHDEVRIVRSAAWAGGISRSLAAGLEALDVDPSVSSACIGLADQPRVGAEAYRRLAEAGAGGADIAVATYGGVRGNPVLLGRPVWDAARRLTGDEGARQLMRDRPVVEVDCTGTGDPADVDTLDDLLALDRSTHDAAPETPPEPPPTAPPDAPGPETA